MDIREYLEEKECKVRERGSDHISTHCFFCDEDTNKAGRLYINVDESNEEKYGVFFCFLCQAKGGINSIREHFGDAPIKNDYVFTSNPIVEVAARYYQDKLLENPEAYKYLTEKRGLFDETVTQARIGWADGGLVHHLLQKGFTAEDIQSTRLVNKYGEDHFKNEIIFPYLEHGVAISLRGKKMGGITRSTPGPLPIPYGIDTLIGEETVTAAEGEIDQLTLWQMGYPAIGLPGVMTFKDEWEEYLDEAKRIYILFDQDKAGKAGAEKLASRLGPRTRVVELPKKGIDVNDYYVKYGKERDDFEYLMRKSKGGLLVSVEEAYERWLEVEGNPDLKGLQLNIPRLDEAMSFGLLPGQVLTMLARTNCLAGDTDLIVNRAGKSFHITIEELVYKIHGGKSKLGKVWDKNIPTKIQRRADDGSVRLVEISDAWCSGVKEVYRLSTVSGREIKATNQHPFLTDIGYVKLYDLSPGDMVYVNVGKGKSNASERKYKAKSGLHHHPYRTKRKVYPGNLAEKSTVQLHRLIAEAEFNGLELEDFLEYCRSGPVDNLTFINPATHVVHHIDEDHTNNELSNLSVLTHEEHNIIHDYFTNNVLDRTELDEIASIEYLGEEVTYDIEVIDDPHNFIANEFVVHNSGKTVMSINYFERMRMLYPDIKILYMSLEQTRNEWFERAYRIHNFYHPGSSVVDTINFWGNNFHIVDKNRINESQLVDSIEQFSYETDGVPDLICIDYLGYYAKGFGGTEYDQVTNAIMGIKAIAKEFQTVIYVPHQANRSGDFGKEPKMDEGRGGGTVEETSDVFITLWNPDQANQDGEEQVNRGEVFQRIRKSRQGGVGASARYQFAPLTLAMCPIDDVLYERALDERQYAMAGDSWKEAVLRHKNKVTEI